MRKIDRINEEKAVLFQMLEKRLEEKDKWIIDKIKEWEDEIEMIHRDEKIVTF
jgi:hypothetical protein